MIVSHRGDKPVVECAYMMIDMLMTAHTCIKKSRIARFLVIYLIHANMVKNDQCQALWFWAASLDSKTICVPCGIYSSVSDFSSDETALRVSME